jgi:hypothetical protein
MKSDLEYRWIWAFSILSTLSGILLAIWMRDSQSGVPIILLGVAHAVVFIPAMIIAHANLWKIISLGLVCITFPIWGYSLVSLLTAGIGSPIANSLIWGVVVALALKQPKAIFAFFVVGVISNAALLWFMFVMKLNTMSNTEGGFAETIGVWYLLVLPVFPLLFQYSEKILPTDQCVFCGYPYEGLSSAAPCPECGTPRPEDGVQPAAFAGAD